MAPSSFLLASQRLIGEPSRHLKLMPPRLKHDARVPMVGFSATPDREDKRSTADVFTRRVFTVDTKMLIKNKKYVGIGSRRILCAPRGNMAADLLQALQVVVQDD